MADKSFEFLIKLKDGMSGVLGSITSKLRVFAGKVGSVFRGVSGAIGGAFRSILSLPSMIAGGAVVGAMTKMVSAQMKQESAERLLAHAIAATGASSETSLSKLKAYASQIQAVTKYGDEAVMSAMTLGLNLGIAGKDIERATQTAVGLASTLGMDLQAAMMLVGRASQGSVESLSEYGIKLDEGLSDQEKFNAVLEKGVAMFANATAEGNTLSGSWSKMSNAIGDLWERLGSLLSTALELPVVFGSIREAIDGLSKESLQDVFGGVLENLRTALGVVKGLISGSITFGDLMGAISDTLATGLSNAVKMAGNYLVAVFGSSSFWMGVGELFLAGLSAVGSKIIDLFTLAADYMAAGIATAIGSVAELLNKIPGIDIGSKFSSDFGENLKNYRDRSKKWSEGRENASSDLADDGLKKISDAFAGASGDKGPFKLDQSGDKWADIVETAQEEMGKLGKKSGEMITARSSPKKEKTEDVKYQSVSLGQAFDIARGRGIDPAEQTARNTSDMKRILEKIEENTATEGLKK